MKWTQACRLALFAETVTAQEGYVAGLVTKVWAGIAVVKPGSRWFHMISSSRKQEKL